MPIDRMNSADCSKDSGEYLFYRAIQNLVNWQEDFTLQNILKENTVALLGNAECLAL